MDKISTDDLPEFFVEGSTVRVRVDSAFGPGDIMYCTMGDWHADEAKRVADALNAASRQVAQEPAVRPYLSDIAMRIAVTMEAHAALSTTTAAKADAICDILASITPPSQEPADWQVEMTKLVDFFRNEGFAQFGNQGDFEGWTPAETAINAMRELAALRAASITPPAPERSKEEVGVNNDSQSADGGVE